MAELKRQALAMSGVMDKQSDLRSVDTKNGNYRDAENVIIGSTTTGVDGSAQKFPGNIQILNPYLPEGENTCIGSYEDLRDDSIIYFVHNSIGKHGIYRYFRERVGFESGRIEPLIVISSPTDYNSNNPNPFGNWSVDRKITGIALIDNYLHWNEPESHPMVLDCNRANDIDKQRRFNVYFNKNLFAKTINYKFFVYEPGTGIPVYTFEYTGIPVDSYADRVAQFVKEYNSNADAQKYFNIESCDNWITIEVVRTGKYQVHIQELEVVGGRTIDVTASCIVPDNFYPDKDSAIANGYPAISEYYFRRARNMPAHEPVVEYDTDADRVQNNVSLRVWQFRVKYVYHDYSRSEWGAISCIPLQLETCVDGLSTDSSNVLNIDYTDEILENCNKASLVREVHIAARLRNTGEWFYIAQLSPYEFVGAGQQLFNFYNDNKLGAVDENELTESYTAVPIKSRSLELINDRLFDAGTIEGYDRPCVDASIDVDYEQNSGNENLFTIKGVVFIRNVLYNSSSGTSYQSHQPIWQQGNTVYFGGWGSNEVVNGGSYQQILPLAGFTMYLAGTDLYGVSKQITWNAVDTEANGAYTYKGGGATAQNIRFGISGLYGAPTSNPGGVQNPWQQEGVSGLGEDGSLGWAISNGCFSTFEIRNVPAGTYSLRVASHLTTQDDLEDLDRKYQRTSTNVMEINGHAGTESVVVVGNGTAQDGIVYVGRTSIADLTDPNLLAASSALTGYVVDQDVQPAPTTYEGLVNDTRISRCQVNFGGGVPSLNPIAASLAANPPGTFSPPGFPVAIPAQSPMIGWNRALTYTDHNGYFFFANNPGVSLGNIIVGSNTRTGPQPLNSANVAFTVVTPGNGQRIAVRNENNTITNEGRTFADGEIELLSGEGVSGISASLFHGMTTSSDGNGEYRLVVYPDTFRQIELGVPAQGRDGLVLYSRLHIDCALKDPIQQQFFSIQIGPAAFKEDTPYLLQDRQVELELIKIAKEAFPRGSTFGFGLVYYDDADRHCGVVTDEELKKRILFYTERDESNNLQPPGPPTLTWTINHEPPEWATKYQWVRTVDLTKTNSLQWVVNSVKHVLNYDGTYSDQGANLGDKVWISYVNIGYYFRQNPGATVGYDLEPGDRIRFIADVGGNLAPVYREYEILEVLQDAFTIKRDASFNLYGAKGATFEIYKARKGTEVDVYYEFGECYPIKSAVINGVQKKYHAGPLQDQTYGLAPDFIDTPARGTFKGGSTYYRMRRMAFGVQYTIQNGELEYTADAGSGKPYFISSPRISDFYDSEDQSVGRIGIDDPAFGRVERPTIIRFSDPYISDTKVNGFSSYRGNNYKQLHTDYGWCNKLVAIDSTLLKAVFENGYVVSMYLQRGKLQDAQGSELITISDAVLNQTNEHQRHFGTINPESVVLNDEGDVFGYDDKGIAWRSSGNGMVEISRPTMTKEFRDQSEIRRLREPNADSIPAIYDRYHDIYIVSFSYKEQNSGQAPIAKVCQPDFDGTFSLKVTVEPQGIDLVNQIYPVGPGTHSGKDYLSIAIQDGFLSHGFNAAIDADGCVNIIAPNDARSYKDSKIVIDYGNGIVKSWSFEGGALDLENQQDPDTYEAKTYCYFKERRGFTERASFTPEYFGVLKNEIVSFQDGQLWIHNDYVNANNFYGNQASAKMTFVFNAEMLKKKILKAIFIDAQEKWHVPEILIEGDSQHGEMMSKISLQQLETIEGKHYSKIYGDINDPAFTDSLLAWINGREMRGHAALLTVQNDTSEMSTIDNIEILYVNSEIS